MKKFIYPLLVSMIFFGCNTRENVLASKAPYLSVSERRLSEENTSYYIDPYSGNDSNVGTDKNMPWKTFKRVNQLRLTKGNTVEILSAGAFKESLFLVGEGTTESPITVRFTPGVYNFYPEKAFKSKFHISNTNDAADSLKAVAFYFLDSKNIRVIGNGAEILFRGKVIETAINNCENITIEGLRYDYKRPTVSEMTVISAKAHFADIKIHKDSKYTIKDSTLIWVGEGWGHSIQNLWQVFNRTTQQVYRKSFPVQALPFSELEKNLVRIHFDKNPGFVEGLTYQNRNTFRDYAAFFTEKSKNILWKNVTVNFMHGMGFVSQFSENITFDSLKVRPKEGSGRTCAAWADILHFSGCKGAIEIKNCYLSAANDDAINVHGTHLRIVDVLSNQKIKVRFMHSQAYGFDAFFKGDSIEFIRAKTLLPFGDNVISNVVRLNEREFELTLQQNIPDTIQENDVIENSTWTPDVTIQNCTIAYIPTRGVLTTTKGKVRIENNTFLKTYMSSILIADDANSWFESGYVRDLTIKNNKFVECGEPVINIHPENLEIVEGKSVHKNILISDNFFKLKRNLILSAKSTENIILSNNQIETINDFKIEDLVSLKASINVLIHDNKIVVSEEKSSHY